MTQIELKREIENTREDLNAAIAGNMTKSRILDISQLLDGLIEEYLEKNGTTPQGAGDDQVSCLGVRQQKGC